MKELFSWTAAVKAAVFVFSCVGFFVPLASAQVQVVDSSNRLLVSPQTEAAQASAQPAVAQAVAYQEASSGAPPVQAPAAATDVQTQMYFQVQSLQQEVLELRGLVEEQAYELKRLKQQRLDDYLSLDKRLTALAGGKAATEQPESAGPSPKMTGSSAGAAGVQSQDELQRYRSAIDLALRQKDYDKAATAFNQYLQDFPQGTYAPNSQYWLGEIFLKQGDLEQARDWFSRLLSDFPDHAKAPDAAYKLGTVYDQLGDKAKARSLLSQVIADSPNTNAARLAKNYLTRM